MEPANGERTNEELAKGEQTDQEPTLKVCFVASEMVPFAKTGGLGDVASALPAFLHGRGHDVRVFVPLYSSIDTLKHEFTPVDFLRDLSLELGGHRFGYSVFSARLPSTDLDVYFINCRPLYERPSIYTGEWDEHLRFALLSRAALECCQRMGWGPDVIHVNDWHTALVPLYLKTLYRWDQLFARTRTVLTIHNIAYQGVFPAEVLPNLGLADHQGLFFQEDLGRGIVNFLKTGVLYADVVSTVSKTYAREIQTEAYGQGLEGLLRERRRSVVGIVNGVDYGTWNPEVDPHIRQNYGPDTVEEGKRANRQHLLDELGLPDGTSGDRPVPVLGIVSRLTAQKGFDLLRGPLPEALRYLDVRVTVLGSGEGQYQDFFHWLQHTFPQKVCFYRGYHEPLAHKIEAGADIFLMPSRFEPCGLNQMYSLKYGTVPVVRKTGGLADTVSPWNASTQTGTGVLFDHFDEAGMTWALKRVLTAYGDEKSWSRLRQNGMARDYSWSRQGQEYETLYWSLAGRP